MIDLLLGNWMEQPLVVLDVETTGFSSDYDRVVEVAAVRVERGRIIDSWSALVDPGRPIPRNAQKAHGITDLDVYMKPKFLHVVSKLVSFTRNALPVAYSAEFDKRMLGAEMDRCSIALTASTHPMFDPRWPWIDPLIWVRDMDGGAVNRSGNKLADACARRGITITNAHRALDDAEATAQLILMMARQIGPMTATQLLYLQNDRAQRWAAAKKKAG
jgi:DNA polymerase III epsilon subunit family exonuclease